MPKQRSVSMDYRDNELGQRAMMFLLRRGYGEDVREYEQAYYELIKNNTPETRIRFRQLHKGLQNKITEEVQKSNIEGNWEDEAATIDEERDAYLNKRKEYKETYGEIPEGFDVDDASYLQEAKQAFIENPNRENTHEFLMAKFKGDPHSVMQEQSRREIRERQEALVRDLEKAAEMSQEAQEAKLKKQEEDEAYQKKLEQWKRKEMNDPRLMRRLDDEVPATPYERQRETEERKSKYNKKSVNQ